jgi:hypothetical protein
MASFIPVPPHILAAGYDDVGYNWCINTWGTKWDFGPEGVEMEHTTDPAAAEVVKARTEFLTAVVTALPGLGSGDVDGPGLIAELITGFGFVPPKVSNTNSPRHASTLVESHPVKA